MALQNLRQAVQHNIYDLSRHRLHLGSSLQLRWLPRWGELVTPEKPYGGGANEMLHPLHLVPEILIRF